MCGYMESRIFDRRGYAETSYMRGVVGEDLYLG